MESSDDDTYAPCELLATLDASLNTWRQCEPVSITLAMAPLPSFVILYSVLIYTLSSLPTRFVPGGDSKLFSHRPILSPRGISPQEALSGKCSCPKRFYSNSLSVKLLKWGLWKNGKVVELGRGLLGTRKIGKGLGRPGGERRGPRRSRKPTEGIGNVREERTTKF